MDAKTKKQLVEQLDIIAGALTVISGTFRGAGSGRGDSDDDGEAGGEVRKPAGKKTVTKAGGKKPAKDEDEADEDSAREALKDLVAEKGKGALAAVLAEFDATQLSEVEPEKYDELIERAAEIKDGSDEYDEDGEVKKAKRGTAASKTAAKKTPAKKTSKKNAPDKESLTERFKELIEADKAAAAKLLKTLKVKKFSDQDDEETDWEDVAEKLEAAFPEDDDDMV